MEAPRRVRAPIQSDCGAGMVSDAGGRDIGEEVGDRTRVAWYPEAFGSGHVLDDDLVAEKVSLAVAAMQLGHRQAGADADHRAPTAPLARSAAHPNGLLGELLEGSHGQLMAEGELRVVD